MIANGRCGIFVSITLVTILLVSSTQSFAQKDNDPTIPLDYFYAKPRNNSVFRLLLSKLHFSLSTGYGRTFYSQDLADFNVLQRPGSSPVIFDKDFNVSGGSISSGYSYWFNDLETQNGIAYNPATDFIASGNEFKFKAPGISIPLNVSVHLEFDKYKIGGGFTFEYHRPGAFEPSAFEDQISGYKPDFGSAFFRKYYAILGVRVYRYYEYSLSVDANIGAFNLTDKFNKDLVQKGIYVNVGPTIEREMSEYFKVFVRPSFDLKSFTLNIPETDLTIPQSMNAAYLSIGLTYRIPALPKCFLNQCTTQINHQHGNKQYRSRVHPFYKKQNPHHGENYPTLIKYKRKNRDKMNPY